MKVAVIIERADIALGGAERSAFELTGKMSQLGPQVDLLAAKGRANSKNMHVLCADRPGKRVSLAVFAQALKNHFSANHYDIIHSILPFSFADVYQPRGGSYPESIIRNAASYQSRFASAYKKATAFANLRRGQLLRAEKALCMDPNGPVIAALSQYVKQQFKNHYALSPERMVVIPGGIRTHKVIDVGQAAKLRTQILARLQLDESSNPVFFLFVANNFRLKGLAALINAMHLAVNAATPRPPHLIVAGKDRPAQYRKLAKKLGITDRIAFIDHIRHIQNAFAIADVAVLPTYYDPCSRFILEALAAVKPVITTRFNGAADLFSDDRHGKIIDGPENVPALVRAIVHFTDTVNIQAACHAIVTDNLKKQISITGHVEKLIGLYQSIIQKRAQQ